jgi:L-fucose isomerase-like protein
VFWVQTGGVENRVLELWRERGKGVALLVAHPRHNSLAASLEALARIRQEGGKGRVFFLRGADDRESAEEVALAVRAVGASAALKGDVFGRVGESSDWLVASSTPLEAIEERFGCKAKGVDIAALTAAYREEGPLEEDAPEWAVWEGARRKDGVLRETFAESARMARALKKLAAEEGVSALTVRCFDLLGSDGVTGCLALSMLADAGIDAACEGDMASMVALRWMRHLTGGAGWMANPAELDPVGGEALLAHCTVPLGMVERYAFRTHFESGIGLGIDGVFTPGPVTLVRLGGETLGEVWTVEGELTGNTHEEGLCRTQARVKVSPEAVREWLERPLGNHVVMVPGAWAKAVRMAAWAAGVEGEK